MQGPPPGGSLPEIPARVPPRGPGYPEAGARPRRARTPSGCRPATSPQQLGAPRGTLQDSALLRRAGMRVLVPRGFADAAGGVQRCRPPCRDGVAVSRGQEAVRCQALARLHGPRDLGAELGQKQLAFSLGAKAPHGRRLWDSAPSLPLARDAGA